MIYVPQQPQVIYAPGQTPDSSQGQAGQAPQASVPPVVGSAPDATLPPGAAQAIDDIQQAWIVGDDSLLQQHVDPAVHIRVYREGVFDRLLSASDYVSSCRQGFDNLMTQSFVLSQRVVLPDGRVRAAGRQVYFDNNNVRQVGYACYWLEQLNGKWVIDAVNGASDPDHLVIDPEPAK